MISETWLDVKDKYSQIKLFIMEQVYVVPSSTGLERNRLIAMIDTLGLYPLSSLLTELLIHQWPEQIQIGSKQAHAKAVVDFLLCILLDSTV